MGKENIYNKLMAAIGNVYGVCGLMGNIQTESNFKSTNMQNSYESKLGMNDATYTQAVDNGSYADFAVDRVGYGLVQWTSSGRKSGLLAFAKERGTSIGDENMQIDYVLHELSTGYKAVLKVLKNATSVKEASDYVCTKYERPADQSEKALANRSKKGEAIYAEFVIGKEESMVRTYKKGVKVQLAPNFKSTEFDCNGKGCCTETLIHDTLIEVLQDVRNFFGKSVNLNCGFRCETHNAKVSGASKNSKHILGLAADIVVKGENPMRVGRYIEKRFAEKGIKGRIGIYTWDAKTGGFVHVDVRGSDARAIYTKNNTDYDNVLKFSISVKKGAKGKIVTVIEWFLASQKYKGDDGKTHKYYEGNIDESCGPKLAKGIELWNAHHGRPNDASWGPKCWNEAFPI